MKKVLAALVLIIVLVTTALLYKKYRIAPDMQFSNIELTDLNGKPVDFAVYRGKKVFMNFFENWCGPCIAEFPSLDQAAAQLAGDNFVFISISDAPLPVMNRLNERLNLQHVVMLHSVKNLHELQVFTYPTNYLINEKGSIVFAKTGERKWDTPENIHELQQKAGE